MQAVGECSKQVRAVEPQAVDRTAHTLGAQLKDLHKNSTVPRVNFYAHSPSLPNKHTDLQTLPLPFVPQTDHTIVRGATGHHVVAISLQTVQCTVMRLLPLRHAFPAGRVITKHSQYMCALLEKYFSKYTQV